MTRLIKTNKVPFLHGLHRMPRNYQVYFEQAMIEFLQREAKKPSCKYPDQCVTKTVFITVNEYYMEFDGIITKPQDKEHQLDIKDIVFYNHPDEHELALNIDRIKHASPQVNKYLLQ